MPETRAQVQDRTPRLGDLAVKALDPLVRKRGFANARLFAQWDAIVGARLADLAVPEELRWRRGRDAGGTLVLGCASGDALEVQHMHGLVIERINAFLGWRAIEAVRLRTGRRPVAKTARPPGRPHEPTSPDAVPDARLEAALTRLGGAVAEYTRT